MRQSAYRRPFDGLPFASPIALFNLSKLCVDSQSAFEAKLDRSTSQPTAP